MRARVILPILLAIIAGLGCLAVLKRVVQTESVANEAQTIVIVANGDLGGSVSLKPEMLSEVRMPSELVPSGAFSDAQKLLGRVLRNRVSSKSPITEAFLAPEGALAGLQGKIPVGYRARAIRIDDVTGVAGFVVPGSNVDVVAAVRNPKTRRIDPRTILRNVQVLAVGAFLSSDDPKGQGTGTRTNLQERSATLLLRPQEVKVVAAHEANGDRLSLSLRSGSEEPGDSEFTEYDDRYSPEPIQVVAPPPPTPTVVVQQTADVTPLERFVTWVYLGDSVQQVTYVRVNGMWMRETTNGRYPVDRSELPASLPRLKTGPAVQASPTNPVTDEATEQPSEPVDTAPAPAPVTETESADQPATGDDDAAADTQEVPAEEEEKGPSE